MYKKLSTEEFIERTKQIHGNKYDYSKVEYINNHTKVCIICPIHGEFWQTPKKHLKGRGCFKCNLKKRITHGPLYSKRLSTEGFIEKAHEIHGDKYDYSKVEYVTMKEKVCIICPEHGEFWQLPSSHVNGHGCPMCSKNKEYTIEEWVKKACEVHDNKYDYSKVEYDNSHRKVCIICPIHGEFWQRASSHLNGQGCPLCKGEQIRKQKTKGKEKFIEEAKKIHGNKYDYSKVEYINSNTSICIICPEHGEFWQMPHNHLEGQGCPYCKASKLEIDIFKWLTSNSIEFIAQKKFEWLKSKQNFLRLDYFLPEYNIAIECQGIQHYMAVGYGGRNKKESEQALKNTIEWDKIKNKLCKEHGIRIIYYAKKEVKEFSKDEKLITDKRLILKELKK